MPQGDLPRHADARERVAFEGGGIDHAVRPRVQVHVDDGGGEILDGGVALVEFFGLLDLVHQRLRHRLAGLVVPREPVEHLARQQPAAR